MASSGSMHEQPKLQNFMPNDGFGPKGKITNTTTTKQTGNIKNLAVIETRTSAIAVGCVTSRSQSQLNVSIVVYNDMF